MGRRSVKPPGPDQLLAGLARLGIATPRLDTLVAAMLATPDLAEKLAHQAASATQALHEAQALAAAAQRDRIAAETAWREVDRIKADLEAANAAHAARLAELDSRAHVIEMRERELENTLHDVAALKAEYESKLAAIEAIVKGPVRRIE
jgi:chromosome segregation ATPase